MASNGFHRLAESGEFTWQWAQPSGLLVIRGGAGGGGGGGGAFCLQDLNLYGASGGGGGTGGAVTTVQRGNSRFQASGGNGGDGGDGGGLNEGKPARAKPGKGCPHGDGGNGGRGAVVPPADGRLVSGGGDGGKGFPGETIIVELTGLTAGERFTISIGGGGVGGAGGKGYQIGDSGAPGLDGFVLFVPLSDN